MRPDPNEMTDFNVLTLNASRYPGTAPLSSRPATACASASAISPRWIIIPSTFTATIGGSPRPTAAPIPEAAQWPEITVLVPVGSTRTVEFIANNPGDWAMHCHMTHHVMNQMGHGLPNLIGVDTEGLDKSARKCLPGYMTMGEAGMAEMGEMGMKVPRNSLPMVGSARAARLHHHGRHVHEHQSPRGPRQSKA